MTKQKFLGLLLGWGFLAAAVGCGNDSNNTASTTDNDAAATTPTTTDAAPTTTDATASDKGIGKFQNVELTHPLDQKMVAAGKGIYEMKCQSCHKLTDEKMVGPGWKGVTDRRTPEWIMNFSTNVDEMLQKDPAAQKMLEECLVRMPNQNLSDEDARAILEFMRNNDGKS
ncbi:c-type cytochrome [Pseudocnuella soli]|uniref:c-type cytochrome n=1 Tax=Pseudocnuella soli TaxID=2502779 RepID=UPI00104F1DE0|nr:cytochrome c [Pseudocnuella soli]